MMAFPETDLEAMDETTPDGSTAGAAPNSRADGIDDFLRETRVCVKNFTEEGHDLATGQHMIPKGAAGAEPAGYDGRLYIATDDDALEYYELDTTSWETLRGASSYIELDPQYEIMDITGKFRGDFVEFEDFSPGIGAGNPIALLLNVFVETEVDDPTELTYGPPAWIHFYIRGENISYADKDSYDQPMYPHITMHNLHEGGGSASAQLVVPVDYTAQNLEFMALLGVETADGDYYYIPTASGDIRVKIYLQGYWYE